VLDSGTDGPSSTVSWIKFGLGVLLLLLGIREWRGRPHEGEEAKMPKWMAAIDRFTPVKAAGMGFLLSALNPKNLMMCVAAGTAVGSVGLDRGQEIGALALFVVLAACSVAIPVIAYAVASDRMKEPLKHLEDWLKQHNAAVMAVLLVVLGTVLVGKGIEGL